MPGQHVTSNPSSTVGIQVPLDLPGLQIVAQWQQADGILTVVVEVVSPTAQCVYCQQECHRVHDRRLGRKRDLALRTYPVELLLAKRRFRCPTCQKMFTETDTACGWRKRTTARLREKMGQLACQQPVARVASSMDFGPRFVGACAEAVAQAAISATGRPWEETQPLPASRFVGIDACALRKGHRYETILCDLE